LYCFIKDRKILSSAERKLGSIKAEILDKNFVCLIIVLLDYIH